MKSRTFTYLVMAVALVALSACAERPMGHHGDPAFVRGLIDGWLAPISLVLSLFSDTIRMYAFPNVGRWYDFGFILGLGCWGGGGATVTRYIYVDRSSGRKIREDVG